LGGGGLFLIYLGFYLLYARYGASYYTLYAVLSILTTSILVGLVFFREPVNVFEILSIAAAFLSIAFWGLSKA
jgi:drug/metabolite transporter (DMT)-like permease